MWPSILNSNATQNNICGYQEHFSSVKQKLFLAMNYITRKQTYVLSVQKTSS